MHGLITVRIQDPREEQQLNENKMTMHQLITARIQDSHEREARTCMSVPVIRIQDPRVIRELIQTGISSSSMNFLFDCQLSRGSWILTETLIRAEHSPPMY